MKNNAIQADKAQAPAARPTVLIVDDSRLMRVAIKKILKDEFELIEAVDGEDAWAKLEAEPAITCVFSDLSMPNLDGYGLLARVRGSGEGRIQALPFIVITGKEGDLGGLLEEVRSHGATDLVGKPFKSDEIIARTRSLLAAGLPQAVPAAVVAPEAVQQVAATPVIPTAEAEAEVQRLLEEQEAMRRVAEAARRQAAEEQARREAAEQEARRLREVEEAAQRAAEEARRQAAEEQARREAAEQEARRLREEQEAARQAAEAARVAAEQAEQERIAVEQAARHQAEQEARICEELRAKARRLAEDQERRRREEAAAALRLGHVPALFVRLALPFMSLANSLLRLGKGEALKQLRKRLP